jgi:hypothetical protein
MPNFPLGKIQRDDEQYKEKKIWANHNRLLSFLLKIMLTNQMGGRCDIRGYWM